MIVVVTGANGFIGTHLIKTLLQKKFTVRCVDNQYSNHTIFENPRIEKHIIDCTNEKALANSNVFDNADYVFHLVGVTKQINLEGFRKINVYPTKYILKILKKKHIPLKRFLFVSTQAVIGPADSLDHPKNEEDSPEPVEFYGKSKWEAEQVVQQFQDQIPCTIVRPSSVYGPRDVDFLTIFKQIMNHLSVYPGYRENYISIIYIRDLTHGMIQAALSPNSRSKTYFLCHDSPVSWEDIHNTIARISKKRVFELDIPQAVVDIFGKAGETYSILTGKAIIINLQKITLSKQNYWICSSERAKKDFGFKPQVSLEEGMKMSYQWYLENGWLKSYKKNHD